MENQGFTMSPQNRGRMRYLLLALWVPLGIMWSVVLLMDRGLIPENTILGFVTIFGSLAAMMILGYFLIFQKNHTLAFVSNAILETNWRRQVKGHPFYHIKHYRRNFLGEYILTDGGGNKILCVEPNMSNFDRFQQWMAEHHIEPVKEHFQ